MTFVGVLVTGFVLVVAVTIGIQMLPIYMEKMSIQRAVSQSAQAATASEVRLRFDRTAQTDDITSIGGKDLMVGKEAGRLVVSYAYSREIHLLGPAYLVLKYAGRSD